MYACILHEYVEGSVDVSRVIRMLLLHDIVELGIGEAPIHGERSPQEQSERKIRAAKRLIGIFPEPLSAELLELWQEFEAASSDDACFAKALERFQPLLVNMFTEGGTWRESDISLKQGESRYGPVFRREAPRLWVMCEAWIEQNLRPA